MTRLYRFSRRLRDTLLEIFSLRKKGVYFSHLDFPGEIDYYQPLINFVDHYILITLIFSFLGEQELASRLERTRGGINKAKVEGKI